MNPVEQLRLASPRREILKDSGAVNLRSIQNSSTGLRELSFSFRKTLSKLSCWVKLMQEITKKQGIFQQWLSWQFFYVPSGILQAWKNFLLFTFNYFSIPILLRTFFFYWRRYRYFYGRGFDLRRFFDAFTFNIISRVIGAIIRSIFIIIGVLSEILVIAGGLILFLGWFFLPFLIIGGLWLGIRLIF